MATRIRPQVSNRTAHINGIRSGFRIGRRGSIAAVQIWGFRDLDFAELKFFRWCDLGSLGEFWKLNAENTIRDNTSLICINVLVRK